MINSLSQTMDNNKIIYSLQSFKIKQQLSEMLDSDELDPDVKKRLTDLDKLITEDNNPVVFIYYLKDKFDLY